MRFSAKKLEEVEAVKWDGTNEEELTMFLASHMDISPIIRTPTKLHIDADDRAHVTVPLLGTVVVNRGEWLLQRQSGVFSALPEDAFFTLYEAA